MSKNVKCLFIVVMHLATRASSQACHSNLRKQIFQINITGLKNPNWREADQLAIYKHDRGVELGSTEKQLQISGQSGT